MRRLPVMAAALATVTLLACGSQEGSGAEDARGDAGEDDTTTSASTTTTTTASTTTTTFPTAADGSDIQACYDGRCEVLVTPATQLTFDPSLRFVSGSVDAVGPQGVDFTFHAPNFVGQFPNVRPGGGGPTMNDTLIEVLGISGDQAVVRLSPSTSPPPTASA